ncbi:MAG: alpha/beta fold hydrolase [Dehalococcoidia bacterium]
MDEHEHGAASRSLSRSSISVDGHPTTYHVAGAGDPVILVHGLAGSSRWWRRNVPALAARYRTYLVDLPRFGAMHGRGRFVLVEAAAWLVAWMRSAGLDHAHIIGHSMGGLIAIRLAAQQPDTVSRLVLTAPAGLPSARSLAAHALPLLRAARHSKPGLLPLLAYDTARAGPRTLWRAAQEIVSEDVRADLAAIRSPTLVIMGENDPLVPPATGRILQERIADARLLVLKAAGHVVMFDQPDAFNRAVVPFLAGEPTPVADQPSGAGDVRH